MELDPKIINKLLEVFKSELEERLQEITDGLLKLEKKDLSKADTQTIIDTIFRSAHNIKGAARTVSLKDIGEIAHQIETLFTDIKETNHELSSGIIDLCLHAVDSMRSAMLTFSENKPLAFNLDELLLRLKNGEQNTLQQKFVASIANDIPEKKLQANSKEQETIRVSIDSLDRVSSLMEEIQIIKIAIEDHYTELSKLNAKTKQLTQLWKQTGFVLQNKAISENLMKLFHASTDNLTEISQLTQQLQKNMHTRINDLNVLSNSLQDEVRTLRLIPAAVLLNPLPRSVRDIAQQLDKKVELEITGDSVKMDKLVLEGLDNPIMHLLRNSIDHGIESVTVRKNLNKPEIGKICIDIREEGDHILITIADDGAGIDVNTIGQLAVRKNIVTKAEIDSMSQQDILDLIFRPGFSTKAIITDLSGRGVGLDVVKSNITNLKGRVHFTTEVNKGTTFHIRVPLTLASERGLLIKSAGQFFVIPTNLIERVLSVPVNEIIEVEASQAIIVDKHPIRLQLLSEILGLEAKELANIERLFTLVIRKGWHAIAFVVDEIIGEREIVVKPLLPPLINVPCVAGGTLGGNGDVIIVLNANDLINKSLQTETMLRVTSQNETTNTQTRPHILVVDDSITTRTLEKNILETNDYQVTTAVNGKEAWDLLQNQKFALLITDVMMPIMDGLVLTERVKKSTELQNLPVIIVTSLGNEIEKKRGIDVGADAYIVKNEFESEKLLEIVEQLV